MKEIIVKTWCDLAHSRGEQAETDGRPYTLAFNGVSVDLDLSDQAVKEITEALAPYMALGKQTTQFKKHGRRPETGPGSAADMRAWGQAHGYKFSRNKGGWFYPKGLREDYAAHLAQVADKS